SLPLARQGAKRLSPLPHAQQGAKRLSSLPSARRRAKRVSSLPLAQQGARRLSCPWPDSERSESPPPWRGFCTAPRDEFHCSGFPAAHQEDDTHEASTHGNLSRGQ